MDLGPNEKRLYNILNVLYQKNNRKRSEGLIVNQRVRDVVR